MKEHSGVSVFAFLCICASMLFFSWLAAVSSWNYVALTEEDYWVEYLTVLWFLLAGILLFFTAAAERSLWRRCLYILGGIGMVFGTGEELSWGQRILGFATPDFLLDINIQDEFNVHNIRTDFFVEIYWMGPLALCVVACAAFFARKYALLKIPLPSILTVLGIILMMSYQFNTIFDGALEAYGAELYITALIQLMNFVFHQGKSLLLLVSIFALINGHAKLFIATTATAVTILASSYVNHHTGAIDASLYEVTEYLLAMCCLFYALELLMNQGSARRRLKTAFSGICVVWRRVWLPQSGKRLPDASASIGSRLSRLFTICFFLIICSIGLILFQYFSARSEAAAIDTAYRAITSGAYGEPAIRSHFEVYLVDKRLIYYKEECTIEDIIEKFFLRIIPVSPDDLPDDRRLHGFDTQVFSLLWHGKKFDGKCLDIVSLPEYDITYIHTGQKEFHKPGWSGSVVVNIGEIEALYRSVVANEPTVRSTFNIYLEENRLTYAKQPCALADIEAHFFLHLIPADKSSLPKKRRQYGFDNLDFDFDRLGVHSSMMFDEKCIVTVSLPEYDITGIRTGQYIPDKGILWEVNIP